MDSANAVARSPSRLTPSAPEVGQSVSFYLIAIRRGNCKRDSSESWLSFLVPFSSLLVLVCAHLPDLSRPGLPLARPCVVRYQGSMR